MAVQRYLWPNRKHTKQNTQNRTIVSDLPGLSLVKKKYPPGKSKARYDCTRICCLIFGPIPSRKKQELSCEKWAKKRPVRRSWTWALSSIKWSSTTLFTPSSSSSELFSSSSELFSPSSLSLKLSKFRFLPRSIRTNFDGYLKCSWDVLQICQSRGM